MQVLVIGSEGNMGRRYQACLNFMGEDYICHDEACDAPEQLPMKVKACDKIIVATPTDTHLDVLFKICKARSKTRDIIDVLCEKPIAKDMGGVFSATSIAQDGKFNLWVVNQYQYLVEVLCNHHAYGVTSYDYWNSGKDGLKWDCFQLFKIANGDVSLRNESPTWKCKVNGIYITPGLMDQAYIDMLADFLSLRELMWGPEIIAETTQKVLDYGY